LSKLDFNLINVTKLLKSDNWLNSKIKKDDLSNPKNGLYVMVFQNHRDVAIHDRNAKKVNGIKVDHSGKVVVPPKSYSIKFGKFEGHFHTRMRGYADHMHYADLTDKSQSQIFCEVLHSALMLPLIDCSPAHINPAAMFENLWNSSISHYLKGEQLLLDKQNMKSEYRLIKAFDETHFEGLSKFTNKIALDILKVKEAIF
jgi:hypothetical protein